MEERPFTTWRSWRKVKTSIATWTAAIGWCSRRWSGRRNVSWRNPSSPWAEGRCEQLDGQKVSPKTSDRMWSFLVKRNVVGIMDDGSNRTLDGDDLQGTGYSTFPQKKVSSDVKYISHMKFPKQSLRRGYQSRSSFLRNLLSRKAGWLHVKHEVLTKRCGLY